MKKQTRWREGCGLGHRGSRACTLEPLNPKPCPLKQVLLGAWGGDGGTVNQAAAAHAPAMAGALSIRRGGHEQATVCHRGHYPGPAQTQTPIPQTLTANPPPPLPGQLGSAPLRVSLTKLYSERLCSRRKGSGGAWRRGMLVLSLPCCAPLATPPPRHATPRSCTQECLPALHG